MKKADKSAKTVRNFDQLISKLSENEILNTHAMSYVRGEVKEKVMEVTNNYYSKTSKIIIEINLKSKRAFYNK